MAHELLPLRCMRVLLIAGAAAAIVSSCMEHGGGHANLPSLSPMIRPEPRDDVPVAPTAPNQSAAPGVVELSLTAAVGQTEYLAGKPTAAWAYNGTIPGPTIQAHTGDEVIVHFRNDLPEPTTIHWHGVRVPNDMDGAGRLLQPIPPGGTFDYRFVVPDEGLFWYHPHVRSDIQVEKGLYGAIVVRDPNGPELGVETERILVLDDVLIDPATGLTDEREDMRAMMMGREGNLLLVNGKPSNGAVSVTPGARVRLRIVNAANARFFNLRLDGGGLIQVGSDGGLLAAPRRVDSVLLVPGERFDGVFETATGARLTTLPYERAHGAGAGEEIDLVRFVPADLTAVTAAPLPSTLRTIDAPASPTASKTLRLGERMAHHGWQFTINGQVFPNVLPIDAGLGTTQLWSVRNESDMDHPLHVHGFFFRHRAAVADADGQDLKDTINIPGRSTVDLLVDFARRAGAAGDWMYHCHILEHAEGGMMGEVRVR